MNTNNKFHSEIDEDDWMDDCFGIDQFGHDWQMDWLESDKPHPGFGGSANIYGGYTSRCSRCNILISDWDFKTKCREQGNGTNNK